MLKKNLKNNPYLSVIIPLYNEDKRLNKLPDIYKYLNDLNFGYEVLIVNDGSTDKTLQVLNSFNKELKFRLISYQKNKGKGFAIKKAMLIAKGTYRLFIDIDLSTPIKQFNQFIPYLNETEILIGSRRISGAHLHKRQSPVRENLGKGFTELSKLILGLNISDFTCGFKCFPKRAALSIFSKQRIKGWSFDSETLYLAKKLGFFIKEIPVRWSHDPRSKVKLPMAIIKSLADLCIIRYYDIRRQYK